MKKDYKLEDLPKSTIYSAPEGYFKQLPQVVMARISPDAVGSERAGWSKLFYPYRTALASLLLLVGFVAVFLFSQTQPDPYNSRSESTLANINQQDALEYVSLLSDIDPGDLTDLNLTDTDVSPEFINASPADILESVDDQQLEEIYLN